MRPFILHAHFYQPERLNPWTGALDPEPSAAPDRDWNARILRECYAPNGAARVFDSRRRVERIVNNYERLSFNFGPTLLTWMERTHPRTYAKMLDGDFRSSVRLGHGNALAQAYNHMILPLASSRDRRTQILWGLADFRARFRREPEGMWLPETAIDQATVDALIDAGVRFTVLAPTQAGRVQTDDGSWRDADGDVDTSMPYRLRHSDGSGRAMAAFFYDGALAQGLAFDPATVDAAVLVERLAHAPGEGLVHAALDGETFGHHHAFGELGLAYALFELAEREGLEPTNYAAALAAQPPRLDAEVVGGEGSAWSCAHGVGRWQRDCGCVTDSQPGWNQEWRGPLRAALDVVREAAAAAFEQRGGALLKDPWAARDDYIHVRLEQLSRTEFLDRHMLGQLDEEQRVDAWTLLEAQRHAMVMYTSCGWFFADVSGIETVYVLRSAARVLGLLDELGVDTTPVRAELLERLGEARSNKPEAGTGADVWRRQVVTAEVTPTRVAAHLALTGLIRPLGRFEEVGGQRVEVTGLRSEQRGRMALATAGFAVTSLVTGRRRDFVAAAVHLGGLDFHGVVAPSIGDARHELALDVLWDEFATAPLARLLRMITDVLDGEEFSLEQSLPEGRQVIVHAIFSELEQRFGDAYARLYTDHRRILEMLTAAGYTLPRDLRAAAELTLSAQLERLLAGGPGEGAEDEAFAGVRDVLTLARTQGYQLDLGELQQMLTDAVSRAAQRAAASLEASDVDVVQGWLTLCRELEIEIDLGEAQEHVYEAAVRARTGKLGLPQRELVQRLGGELGLSPRAWGA